MKRFYILIFFFLTTATDLFAQISFKQIHPPPDIFPLPNDFIGVNFSSVAFADIDGDNDQDLLTTGYGIAGAISKLYKNDGSGSFTEVLDTPFEGVSSSSIAFADVDGDNDYDILITGNTVAKLYENDGSGFFSEVLDTPFEGVSSSSVAFADVDGDGDQDVLISGYGSETSTNISKLYKNDGTGNFTEVTGTPFEGVSGSFIAFSDIDGDKDMDVLIAGNYSSRLFENNGSGVFSEVSETPFDLVYNPFVAFADVDGDNDQDVLIIGDASSRLYKNDGSGNFSYVLDNSFEGVWRGSACIADIDGDKDIDVLISGAGGTKLYKNDGSGVYSEVLISPFKGIDNSSIAFADVDGDNDQDVFIAGEEDYTDQITSRLYINDGNGNFTEVVRPYINSGSSASFADIDGDQDKDLLVAGVIGNHGFTKLYRNNGDWKFSEVGNTPFPGVENSSIAFADIDGDKDQDVLITGLLNNGHQVISRLYRNDGSGHFTEEEDTPFLGVYLSSVAFSDVDNDGDEDVLITGHRRTPSEGIAKLYQNDGTGIFTEVLNTPFEGVSYSSIAFADVDGDNDQDVLITGGNSKLYENDGSGNFQEILETPFEGVVRSSIAFSDVDGDEDKDVLITGRNVAGKGIAKLYKNNGFGSFSEVLDTPFEGVGLSSVAFADIDGDNDEDVLLGGIGQNSETPTKLYLNDGFGNFFEVLGMPFIGCYDCTIEVADIDMDNDNDILISRNIDATSFTKSFIYENTSSEYQLSVNTKDYTLYLDDWLIRFELCQ